VENIDRGVALAKKCAVHLKSFSVICLIVAFAFVAVSCGGVQRNPTTPNFGQQQPGAGTGLPGVSPEAGGAEGKAGAKAGSEGVILEGDYETLIPQAENYLETGDLTMAFNAYHSALALRPNDPQAAFGKAVCQLAKDWRTFALFTGAGADKLYFGTPLLMHHELMPNPVDAEDSYLLRIFTLGRRYEENFSKVTPSWAKKPVKKESTTGPVVSPPAGGAKVEGEKTPAPEGKTPPSGEGEEGG
jgi:hypothetical protein